MGVQRRKHGADFKAKVALAAIRGEKTLAQLSSEHGVHANQITKWKREVMTALPQIFGGSLAAPQRDGETEALVAQLYQQIGQMKVELDFMRRKSTF